MNEDATPADVPDNSLRVIARDELEEETRLRLQEENNQKLSERCRALALGITAVVWGLLAGETKLAHTIHHDSKNLLVLAAGLSILALLADYLEYVCGYWDNYLIITSAFRTGRRIMFLSKQCATAFSVVLLFTGVAMILWPVHVAAGERGIPRSIWKGEVWSDSDPNVKTQVTLYIRYVDPFDSSVIAEEGKQTCKGLLERRVQQPGQVTRLELRCGNATLHGEITPENESLAYHGEYFFGTSTGHFWLHFGRNY